MANIIVVAALIIIIGAAAGYVIKAKRSGKKCIGCPGGSCAGCSCHSGEGE